MSRADPSAAAGMVATENLHAKCTCGHLRTAHNVSTTTGGRFGCSAWVQGFCDCKRYTEEKS